MPVTRNQANAASNAKSDTAASSATDGAAPRENSDGGETSTETEPFRQDSPENCSICLGPFSNKSFTSSCAHSFCFVCLKQWSKVKAECPLCKQPFTSIFHNIRSNDSYDIYTLPPQNPPRQIDYINYFNYMGGNLTNFTPTNPYYILSRPSLDADLTLSNFSRFQFRHRRYDRYLNPQHPVHGEHQYSYSSSSFNPSTHVSAAAWPRGPEDFRHRVYRHRMGPPAVILGCENSTYRLTPAMVAASGHRLQRIMPWLARELYVLLRTHQNVRLAVSVIQPLLTEVIIDSPYFNERVSPLIGERSRQFIQEFSSFANSALTMQAFDRKAMYRRREARFLYDEDTSISSSDDDDDVVEVTNVSSDPQAIHVVSSSSNAASSLQRAGWDSPTPGPSWESMDAQNVGHRLETDMVSISSESDEGFRPDLNDSDSDNSNAGSDIVFVKYDKPWNERSPIQLSSDSDGDGHNKKKKKAKHKKKQKESLEFQAGSSKKGKEHKSSKSRSREKIREKPKTGSGDECQQAESSTSHKRTNSATSSGKQKRKKHKRSKDRIESSVSRDRDRELVDRLFAEAVTQQQSSREVYDSRDENIPCSSKSKEKNMGKSSDRDRHKRKKKKNRSRGSASPSVLPAYKKHHSGHKKSQEKQNQESERRRHQHRRSRESAASEHPAGTSLERELRVPRNQPLSPANVGPSVASTFQTSYLARSDTVQHIPLNLWVSTWPSLPVSHTFPPPSSSSSFPLSSASQPFASSSFLSYSMNHSSSERNSSAMDSQTISSESDSSTDSNTDDSPDKGISLIPSRTRTKQWLDANFSETGSRQTISSVPQSEPAVSDATRNWGIENLAESSKIPAGPSDDVVSIASGDEDVVVCSSASSEKSESDEIRVIENCDIIGEGASTTNYDSSFTASSIVGSAATDHADKYGSPSVEQDQEMIFNDPLNKATSFVTSNGFQSFKLSIKSALNKIVSPFLSSVAQNSGDEETGDTEALLSCQEEAKAPDVRTSCFDEMEQSTTSFSDSKTTKTTTGSQENGTGNYGNIVPQVSSGMFESSLNAASNIPIPLTGSSHVYPALSGEKNIMSSTFSLPSTSTEPMFGVMPALQAPTTASVSSVLSSTLSYLPYAPLSVSSSLSSMLPQPPMPFVVPQAPPSPTLPLHFPFPPLQSLLPGSSNLYPNVYPSYSQNAQATAEPASAHADDADAKSSFSSSTNGDKLTVDTQSENIECPAQDIDDSDETKEATENLEQAPDFILTAFSDDFKSDISAGPSSKQEIPAFTSKLLISELIEKEQTQSSEVQDWTELGKSAIASIGLGEADSNFSSIQKAYENLEAESSINSIQTVHESCALTGGNIDLQNNELLGNMVQNNEALGNVVSSYIENGLQSEDDSSNTVQAVGIDSQTVEENCSVGQ